MKSYSMIFLDIDGTLLDSRHQISENTKKLLNRLQKRDIPVVLCSARSPSGVRQIAEEGQIFGPRVCYGGGLILDADDSILEERGIPLSRALEIRSFIRKQFPSMSVSTYLYDVWLTDEIESPAIQGEMAITGCKPLVCPLESAAKEMEHVHKLLCIGEPGQINALQRLGSKQFPEIDFLYSKSTYLEIVSKEANKGFAVDVVRRHYGVMQENTVACGDHFTDIPMLEAAGLSIAMGNAPDTVKKAADRVTATNDQEGVYIALKNLRYHKTEII